LCGEDSYFVKTSFEMRFCSLDLGTMTFKYAKSPKERFTEIQMVDILFVGTQDDKRSLPIKVKDMHDLKFLLHIRTKKRTYVFSANTRPDQNMWAVGFNAFF
jgi:hypothetical protein